MRTMNVRVPAAAPATPPDTGASMSSGARCFVSDCVLSLRAVPWAEAATTLAVAGSMVEQSTRSGAETPPGAEKIPCF